MSRNLCRTDCYFCGHEVKLVEAPRKITKREAGAYFNELEGLIVANAECPICLARYLAWVDDRECKGRSRYREAGYSDFYDLSFRSTFDDEPGDKDLPQYDVQIVYLRTGRINQRLEGRIRKG